MYKKGVHISRYKNWGRVNHCWSWKLPPLKKNKNGSRSSTPWRANPNILKLVC